MAHEWILEVLQDMRGYSQKNGLSALVVQLDETLRVATQEIALAARRAAPDGGDDPTE
jgi:soluble cytochrome b562